MGTTVRFN